MSSSSSEPAVLVLDTYLRGLRKLAGLAREVDALEAEVAGREAEALREVLEQVRPLVPSLVRPVSIKEPWLPLAAADVAWREPAVVLVESFQQDQGAKGRVTHSKRLLLLVADGRLVELELRGAWTEGPGTAVSDATWRVDSSERQVSPELARHNLRPILSGLLLALKDALVKGRAERSVLKARLELLGEVDLVLRRRKTAAYDRPAPSSSSSSLTTSSTTTSPGALTMPEVLPSSEPRPSDQSELPTISDSTLDDD